MAVLFFTEHRVCLLIAQGVSIIDEVKVHNIHVPVYITWYHWMVKQVGAKLLWSSRSQKFIGHAMSQDELTSLWCIQHSQPWLQKATNYVYPPNSMERSDVRFRCHRSAFYQRCYLSSSLPLQYTYGVDISVPYLRIWGGSGGVWWCIIQYDHDKGDERCRKESIQVRDMYMYYCIILHCIITAQILTHQSFLASSLPTLIGWYTLSFALVIK